jgi:hypothetical protein
VVHWLMPGCDEQIFCFARSKTSCNCESESETVKLRWIRNGAYGCHTGHNAGISRPIVHRNFAMYGILVLQIKQPSYHL